MILLIGGAYQGKLAFAKETYHLTDGDVFTCTGNEIDFSKKCVYAIEEFTWACLSSGGDPIAYFKAHRADWENAVLICQDLSGGVVPMGADMRLWRQETGKLCQYLAREAQQVSRIFCGLEHRLK